MKIKSRSIFFFPVNVQLLKTLSFLCSTFVTLLKKKNAVHISLSLGYSLFCLVDLCACPSIG